MARKGKRGGADAAPEVFDLPHTENAFKETFHQLASAKKDWQEQDAKAKGLKAIFNNKKKVLYGLGEKLGHDKLAIDQYLALRERDVEDIDRETRNLNTLCKFMGLPLGAQLGLFDDGVTVAHAVDTAKIAEAGAGVPNTAHGAYNLGYEVGKSGDDLINNPYPQESELRTQWLNGWEDAQEEIARSMAPDAPGFDEDDGAALEANDPPAEVITLPKPPARRGRPRKTETGAAAH